MKIISKIILFVAIALIIYGYWGAFTNSGNKYYDEMDAYFPFFMMIFGIVILFVLLIVMIIKKRKARRSTYGASKK